MEIQNELVAPAYQVKTIARGVEDIVRVEKEGASVVVAKCKLLSNFH